jgi:Flp pilus assembly protein TadB
MCLAESVVLLYFLQTILAVAASLGVVVFSTPAFLLPLVLIAIVYWFIGLLYVTTSRELKRMDVSFPSIACSYVNSDDANRQTEHDPITPFHQFLRSPSRHVHH